MILKSTAFGAADPIPKLYTGEGKNISPPLLWENLPLGTVTLAALVEDPDAPQLPEHDHPFVHWVLFNVPASTGYLPEGVPTEVKVEGPVPCEQGVNSFGRIGYAGPLPPVGHGSHRYIFRLFALSRSLRLPKRANKKQLLREMEGAVLAHAELVGTYERRAEAKTLRNTA